MGRFIFPVILAVALSLSGCKGPCRQLSEKLCECTATSVEKNNCLTNAGTKAGLYPPDAEQDAHCQDLLSVKDGGCDCLNTNTLEGKQACGLAR